MGAFLNLVRGPKNGTTFESIMRENGANGNLTEFANNRERMEYVRNEFSNRYSRLETSHSEENIKKFFGKYSGRLCGEKNQRHRQRIT